MGSLYCVLVIIDTSEYTFWWLFPSSTLLSFIKNTQKYVIDKPLEQSWQAPAGKRILYKFKILKVVII